MCPTPPVWVGYLRFLVRCWFEREGKPVFLRQEVSDVGTGRGVERTFSRRHSHLLCTMIQYYCCTCIRQIFRFSNDAKKIKKNISYEVRSIKKTKTLLLFYEYTADEYPAASKCLVLKINPPHVSSSYFVRIFFQISTFDCTFGQLHNCTATATGHWGVRMAYSVYYSYE